MKKRMLALFLALILTISFFTLPTFAATAKQVHTCLKEIAQAGSYDENEKWWFDSSPISEDGSLCFGVFYLESDKYIELSIYNDYFEVTWRISGNPEPPYNAFIRYYDEQGTKGTVSLSAGYNGTSFSAFKSYTGDTAYKESLLEALNYYMPAVFEFTRAIIDKGGFTLRDLGMTGYKQCRYVHLYDDGKITDQPTCGASGVMTYTCKICGYTYDQTIDPTGEHSWDGGTVLVPASCVRDGTRRYTCRVCSLTRDESIPATGVHTWNAGSVAAEPSCTEPGIRRFACTQCGTTRDEQIPALGHAWKLTEVLTEPDEEHGHGTAVYTCSRCGGEKESRLCAGEIFTDMPREGKFSHIPIDWAWLNGITSGKSETTFQPKGTCTRGEVVTFLWNAAGKPEPETAENPFEDVKEGKYYYKAVLWAVENGITSGTTDTTFEPKAVCSRGEIVTFLWNAAGKPEPETTENPFEDVKEGKFYYKAVLWAVENHVTSGVSQTSFAPKNTSTREQVVTFLYYAHLIPAPEPAEPTEVLGWRWLTPEDDMEPDVDMDWEIEQFSALPAGFMRVLVVTVHGDGVPAVYTDEAELLRVQSVDPLPDNENGDREYVWWITPLQTGTSRVYCELEGETVRSLTVTVDDTPADPGDPTDPADPSDP